MKVFLIGDIHSRSSVDNVNWFKNSEILRDFVESLPITKDDVVIQLGDVFNKNLNYGKVNLQVIQIFKTLATKALRVYVVEGNHGRSIQDGANTEVLWSVPGVEIIYKPEVISISKDLSFLALPSLEGIPYGPAYENYINEKKFEDVDLLVGHGMISETKMFDAGFLNLDKLTVKFKEAIFGDIHEPSSHGNRHSIGSVWDCTVAEAKYPHQYMVYEDGKLTKHPIPFGTFCEFEFLTYPDLKFKDPKNFKQVSVTCKKHEKVLIEREIKKAIPSNLYEIKWDYVEDISETVIEKVSDDNLEAEFFKNNKFPKEVVEMFNSYLVS